MNLENVRVPVEVWERKYGIDLVYHLQMEAMNALLLLIPNWRNARQLLAQVSDLRAVSSILYFNFIYYESMLSYLYE